MQWIDKWFKHDMNEPYVQPLDSLSLSRREHNLNGISSFLYHSVFLDTMLNFIEVCMVSTEETANRKRVKRALANHVRFLLSRCKPMLSR